MTGHHHKRSEVIQDFLSSREGAYPTARGPRLLQVGTREEKRLGRVSQTHADELREDDAKTQVELRGRRHLDGHAVEGLLLQRMAGRSPCGNRTLAKALSSPRSLRRSGPARRRSSCLQGSNVARSTARPMLCSPADVPLDRVRRSRCPPTPPLNGRGGNNRARRP
jgi:hypothetical protein